MKNLRNIFSIVLMVLALMMQSCERNELNPPTTEMGILPERFKVDIPNSLSNDIAVKSSNLKSTKADGIVGNEIYNHLNFFIAVGEGAADIVVHIIAAIAVYDIDEAMVISFESDDDHRVKNLEVIENTEFEGKTWEYMLTISDALSEAEADGGKAIQVLWNRSPIEGIAILKPYNMDRRENENGPDAVFRIDYSEVGTDKYDNTMMIEIAGLPMPSAEAEPYAINSMKMFVGKKGDHVDVYGNSDHPNATFFTETQGFSWSFVAAGNDYEDVAVAEVGLPPSDLDENSREVLLEEYSMKNVLTREITEWFVDSLGIAPDSTSLASHLQNADAPGFFDDNGFIQGGTSPGGEYDVLVDRIQELAPYNPLSVHELSIMFKE